MQVKPEYRNRDDTERSVLGALADRHEDGMTVFELRAEVEEDIDTLEDALAQLKADQLIEASEENGRTVVVPKDHVITTGNDDADDEGFGDSIRDKLPF